MFVFFLYHVSVKKKPEKLLKNKRFENPHVYMCVCTLTSGLLSALQTFAYPHYFW